MGQKTKAGIYRKQGREIQVLNPSSGAYQPAGRKPDPEVQAILKLQDPAAKLAALRASDHPQARFLWAILREVFHYAAYWLGDIANNARDLDLAIRWGFGWTQGPLETWQAAGWEQVACWIASDIQAGEAMDHCGIAVLGISESGCAYGGGIVFADQGQLTNLRPKLTRPITDS